MLIRPVCNLDCITSYFQIIKLGFIRLYIVYLHVLCKYKNNVTSFHIWELLFFVDVKSAV